MSDLHDKIRDFYRAELKRAKAEMNAALDEVACLLQRREKVHGPLQKKSRAGRQFGRALLGSFL
jgi:hypothetical protein